MGRSGNSAAEDRQMMTGAQALVRALEDAGVTDIFGMPGGAILPFYDPLLSSLIEIGRASCRERV